jgi:hypothetical protein
VAAHNQQVRRDLAGNSSQSHTGITAIDYNLTLRTNLLLELGKLF